MSKNNKFLAMWDNMGLECLFDITDLDHELMLSTLKGQEVRTPFNLSMMMLRAQVNNQRHYEIYTFETDASVCKKQIEFMFTHNPQGIVNLIREQGNKIYSDTVKKKPVIV